jgi:RNA polymerase sigma factor (sigma-70 family)
MDEPGSPRHAFDQVYRQHADAVYRFCLSQLRDPAAAEDLAADVFAAAYAAFERAHPEADGVRPWLFRIARNGAIDRARRERSRRHAPLGAAARVATVEDQAAVRDELRAVLAAIAQLRERDRLLVGLRVAGGLSFAEVGAVTGMREDAARMATQRALQRIRSEVERS